MRVIEVHRQFNLWRQAARGLLLAGVRPEEVLWVDTAEQATLPGLAEQTTLPDLAQQAILPGLADQRKIPSVGVKKELRVPAAFVELSETVAMHRRPDRWGVLYRALWRITHGEPDLLKIEVDNDIRELEILSRQVSCDKMRMAGFVRFQKVAAEDDDEHFIAFHKPDHYIVRSVAPGFTRRFGTMKWSIFTPDDSAHWDLQRLTFSAGVERAPVSNDDLEGLWRSYYRAAFIPARANEKLINKHIPRRYRQTLPEGKDIDALLDSAS